PELVSESTKCLDKEVKSKNAELKSQNHF
ncbi:MAG: hypothetical protein ACI8P7_001343, partial [Candidatus Azotimanducaceae bacterium]